MKRTVLLIGALGGVGVEVADQLSERYQLLCTVRNAAQRKALKTRIPTVRAIAILDLNDGSSIRAKLEKLIAAGGADLAAVVVCAAMCPRGPLEFASVEELARTLQVNAVSHVSIYQACISSLRRSKGRFVFVSSYSGKVGMPFTGVYVASKFALEGLADVMRREAAGWGVDVVLVEPGGIKTNMALNQLVGLDREHQALPRDSRSRYRGLYRQFTRLVQWGYPAATAPRVVAKTICTAVAARKPRIRYPVGADAKELLRFHRASSDRKLDRMCRRIFENAGKLPAKPV